MSAPLLVILILALSRRAIGQQFEVDPNGYIIYCPCMGRFGNQAEQFLGSLQFAKHLNRTLILPPFIEYVKYEIKMVPFKEYLDIKPLREYHRVISMDVFIAKVAPLTWKEGDRSIWCYTARNFDSTKAPVEDCNALEGSPFREFWAHIGVTAFDGGSTFYEPLHTDYNFAKDWVQRFGREKVIAFVGAPSSFPTNSRAVQLQRFVQLSSTVAKEAQEYRKRRAFSRVPYLSLHIRHGADWYRACDLLHTSGDLRTFFSSQQCLGTSGRLVSYPLCLPTVEQMVDSIMFALAGAIYRRPNEHIKHIHIATDADNLTLWQEIHGQLPEMTLITPMVTLHPNGSIESRPESHPDPPHYMVDVYLMSHANVFLGNCISSFSAFASRYRIWRHHFGESTHFFAHDQAIEVARIEHDEL